MGKINPFVWNQTDLHAADDLTKHQTNVISNHFCATRHQSLCNTTTLHYMLVAGNYMSDTERRKVLQHVAGVKQLHLGLV